MLNSKKNLKPLWEKLSALWNLLIVLMMAVIFFSMASLFFPVFNFETDTGKVSRFILGALFVYSGVQIYRSRTQIREIYFKYEQLKLFPQLMGPNPTRWQRLYRAIISDIAEFYQLTSPKSADPGYVPCTELPSEHQVKYKWRLRRLDFADALKEAIETDLSELQAHADLLASELEGLQRIKQSLLLYQDNNLPREPTIAEFQKFMLSKVKGAATETELQIKLAQLLKSDEFWDEFFYSGSAGEAGEMIELYLQKIEETRKALSAKLA